MITQRIDAITAIGNDWRREDPPAPRSVKIELTGRCNYRCGFCALRTRKVQPKGDMDFGLFKRITREMKEAGVEEIGCFYLGESFMAPQLLTAAIHWCKRELKFPYVFLTTNGSLCTRGRLHDVMNAGLDSLKFSINAADEEQFEKVMGVKTSLFHQAIENVKVAREVVQAGGYRCGIYASSIKYDGEQGEKMEKLLNEHIRPYVDEHYWLPLYSMGSLATKREEELGYRPTAGNQGRLGVLREPLPCWSVMSEGHVRSDGHMSACCFGSDDYFDIGDLNTHSFMEVWNSPTMCALRKAHLRRDVKGTVCENCVAYQE